MNEQQALVNKSAVMISGEPARPGMPGLGAAGEPKTGSAPVSPGAPGKTGLYDPTNEHDSCGVGFVAHIKGQASHEIVTDALKVLVAMEHRGACGCEVNTGDGAGILTALPHEFLARMAREELGVELPGAGRYAVGIVFLPTDDAGREACKGVLEKYARSQKLEVLGWRRLPTDNAMIGKTALAREPVMEQVFLAAPQDMDQAALERNLYIARKQTFHEIGRSNIAQNDRYYVCSLSSKVMIHKGQLTSTQVEQYFKDLSAPDFKSHLAMVHSRFSTNTFPSWERAQPMRFMSHNGEINTLWGNINWMRAREGLFKSDDAHFGDELSKIYPLIDLTTSDSGVFDNVLEFLLMAGRSLPEAVMMMIPEAWENHESMPPYKRAFYEYHSCLMEPWDGPASIAFTDGCYIGAVLDRNGLRPSRYYVTHDDRVIMASEVGVLGLRPEQVKAKGRLQPGKMFLVNFEEGRIVADEELKKGIATRRPYGQWLRNQRIELADLHPNQEPHGFDPGTLLQRLQAFGYTVEHLNMILYPMVTNAKEPLGSMGNDAALACLSDEPRLTYDYFKQLFAQVTNPPIDSTREEIIMSLECFIGPEGNLLDTTEQQCHRLHVPHPILSNEQLAALKHVDHRGWRARTIDITFEKPEVGEAKPQAAKAALVEALDRICAEASEAIKDGYSLIVLSDRAMSALRVPISSLLAVGAVHHHLVRTAERTKLGIVLESGEAREVHDFCMLVGYGADAINPYLAFEACWQMARDGVIPADEFSDEAIVDNFVKSIGKGMLKVMAKMGISTLASYKGAQIFEAVGLNSEVVDKCFTGTASRIQGVGFDVLTAEAMRRHEIGYPSRDTVRLSVLANPGEYHWRAGGTAHMWNPGTIASLQVAARSNSRDAYWQFARQVNEDAHRRCTLRGLLQFRFPKADGSPALPLDEVEPVASIVKRFRTGAMSYGSISKEAHETLAVAMNRMGGRSNTGEGGEDMERWTPMANGDSKNSAIKQVASGRFGVTISYLANARELQIKMAQGAKPGEGGELPGHKVSKDIARTRHTTPGVMLISPPPHHDIYSIEDLAQLIYDLKNSNPEAGVSVKLVSEVGVGTIAAGVAKAHADHILISGHEGGTGASPLTGMKHAGLPWELGIAETHQTLVLNDLRSRVTLETDGQLKTGRDIVIAAMLGAEEYGMSTAPLIVLGCIMMRKCHLNTCPVGIATQDPELRKKFAGKPEHVVNYLFMVAEEARQIMAQLGIRTWNELIGRVDLLDVDDAIGHWKAKGLDLSPILAMAQKPHEGVQVRKVMEQDHGLAQSLDRRLIELARIALDSGKPVSLNLPIRNVNRTVGTTLSNRLVCRHGAGGLPEDTIYLKFNGSAGQSLGAWLAPGITIELEGDANDYVGKGLCGGRLVIYPPKTSTFQAEENVIIGNVALYGATSGYAFFRGVAAERFAVRNSGAHAVIEGVGDHGCEYMTGGRVVILGKTGRNFAAGMSGGIAYVWDVDGNFLQNCNLGMVELERLDKPHDIDEARGLITMHQTYTGSTVAQHVLGNWDQVVTQFVKVMPSDYKRILESIEEEELLNAAAHSEVGVTIPSA
ncbi:MAG: glutamate synthase large subunit [Phycisphaeraceae bacterium]